MLAKVEMVVRPLVAVAGMKIRSAEAEKELGREASSRAARMTLLQFTFLIICI